MKQKTLFFALFLLSAATLLGQKKPSKAEIDASNIIRYSNTVITLGNAYNQGLSNYVHTIENADYNLNRVIKNPNMQPFAVKCDVVSVQNSQKQDYTKALTGVQAFPEKDAIKAAVDQGENAINDISTWCANLSNYFSTKAYQQDAEGQQYGAIKDSLNSYMNKAQNSWSEASRLASVAGNRAELILLQGSPIASFVIPMKTDLIGLDEIIGSLNKKDADLSSIKNELTSLSATLEKNKDINTKDVSKLSDAYYKEVYKNYYQNLGECLSHLNRVVDALQNNPDDVNSVNNSYQYVKSYYNKVIENYNTFIRQ